MICGGKPLKGFSPSRLAVVDADLEVRYFIDGVFEDYAILFTDMSQDGCCEEFEKTVFWGCYKPCKDILADGEAFDSSELPFPEALLGHVG